MVEFLPGVGVAALVAGVIGFALACVTYFVQPQAPANRRLALLLAYLGLGTFFAFGLRLVFAPGSRGEQAAYWTGDFLYSGLPFVHFLFLATIDSPLSRPFRGAAATAFLVAATLSAHVFYDVFRDGGNRADVWLAVANGLAALYSLVVTLSALRRTRKGSLRRTQAKAYAWAFGIRDAVWIVNLLVINPFYWETGWGPRVFFFAVVVSDLLLFLLLSYGILKTQLFDIDLRVKAGLGRTAVVGAVAAAFFVVSEVAEAFLPVDGLLPGLVGAALVTVAVLPLHRATMRVLERVLPEDTPAYRLRRKQDVYALALADLAGDGRLTPAEQAQLSALRLRLGLAESP